MAGLPWVSVGDNCRLTQCWRSAILSDLAHHLDSAPGPLKCELRPHLRKSWRGRVHCQGRAKRARRVALTVDSSPPIHTQEGEADPKSRPSFTHYFCDRAFLRKRPFYGHFSRQSPPMSYSISPAN